MFSVNSIKQNSCVLRNAVSTAIEYTAAHFSVVSIKVFWGSFFKDQKDSDPCAVLYWKHKTSEWR